MQDKEIISPHNEHATAVTLKNEEISSSYLKHDTPIDFRNSSPLPHQMETKSHNDTDEIVRMNVIPSSDGHTLKTSDIK